MIDVTDGNIANTVYVQDTPQLILNKNVVTFIESLLSMTLCPINHTTFKESYTGPDHYTYEKEAIERWLSNHITSPMFKSPLYIHQMREDVTMKKLIAALDSHHVDEDMLKNITATNDPRIYHNDPSPTQDTMCTEDTEHVLEDVNQEFLSRRQKKRRKVLRQRQNKRSKKGNSICCMST